MWHMVSVVIGSTYTASTSLQIGPTDTELKHNSLQNMGQPFEQCVLSGLELLRYSPPNFIN